MNFKLTVNHTGRGNRQGNLIKIKTISVQNATSTNLKLGLINIRSLTSKAALVNELITDNHVEIPFLTETRLKPDEQLNN